MISVSESAKILGITGSRVRELIRLGILPAQKVGREWLVDEADVFARRDRKPSVGRPRGTIRRGGVDEWGVESHVETNLTKRKRRPNARGSKLSSAAVSDGPANDAARDSHDFHETYLACKKDFSVCPTIEELAGIQNPEEKAFRVAVSDFFLAMRQRELVRQKVF